VWRIVISVLCMALVGCTDIQKLFIAVPPSIEADEYSVYTDLIAARYENSVFNSNTGLTTIFSPTRLDELKQKAPEADPLIFADFQKRNEQQYPLDNQFNLSSKPILLSLVDFGKIVGPDLKPELFRQAFPNAQGYVTLSRVGFNATRTQAVVYVQEWKGPLNGTGYLYLMTKTGNHWTVKTEVMDFIS